MSYPYQPAGAPGYPPQGGYPPAPGGYPQQGGGYPPAGGYPPGPAPGGYPPAPAPGGYPPQAGGYPPAPGGFPSAAPLGGMPQPGYGPPQPGYPPQAGYPAQAPAAMPSADYGTMPGGGLPYAPQPSVGFATAAMASTAFRNPGAAPAPMPGGPGMPTPQAAYAAMPAQAPPPAQAAPKPSPAPVQQPPVAKTATPPTQQMAGMSLAAAAIVRGTGTVKPKANFDAQKEAEIMRKAMKGLGCDEAAIISVVSTVNAAQRVQIALAFKTMYGKDLVKNLKGELKGKLETIVLYLIMLPAVFDAHQLRKAMKGLGTDESVLIEILCTRTNHEIKEIREAYKKEFSRDLEKDVVSETSGHFKRLLISMVQGSRSEDQSVDMNKAKADAKALVTAGEARWGTDESTFNSILASRSYPQLRATFDEYSKLVKYSIEQSIKREMSGDLEKGMLTIVDCVRNTPKYFAEKLYKSMKGLGTDDDTLIRVIISRCEIDMVEIKQEFQRAYNQTLGRFIKGDTSGDYRKVLLALVGGDN